MWVCCQNATSKPLHKFSSQVAVGFSNFIPTVRVIGTRVSMHWVRCSLRLLSEGLDLLCVLFKPTQENVCGVWGRPLSKWLSLCPCS